MENYRAVLCALQDFSVKQPIIIPGILEEYLRSVARTGRPLFPWVLIERLFVAKVKDVLFEFCEDLVKDDLHTASYDTEADRIVQTVRAYPGIPFTIQRMCELLTQPRKQYKQGYKFLRAFSKVTRVSIMIDPYGKPEESPLPSRKFKRKRTKVWANKSKDLSSMGPLPASHNTAGKAATSSDPKQALAAVTCVASGNSSTVSPHKQETPGGARAVNWSASRSEKRGLEVAQPPVVMAEMVEIHRDMEDDKQSITRCYADDAGEEKVTAEKTIVSENDKSKKSLATTRKPMEDITGLQHSDRPEGTPFSKKFGAKYQRKRKLEKKYDVNQKLCSSRSSNSTINEEKMSKLAESADIKSDNWSKKKHGDPSTSPFKNKTESHSVNVEEKTDDHSANDEEETESDTCNVSTECLNETEYHSLSPPDDKLSDGSSVVTKTDASVTSASQPESPPKYTPKCSPVSSPESSSPELPPHIADSNIPSCSQVASTVESAASVPKVCASAASRWVVKNPPPSLTKSPDTAASFFSDLSEASASYPSKADTVQSLPGTSVDVKEVDSSVNVPGGFSASESPAPSDVPKISTCEGSLFLSVNEVDKDFISRRGQKDGEKDSMAEPVTLLENHGPSTVPKTLAVTGSLSLSVVGKENNPVCKELRQEDILTDNMEKPVSSLGSHVPSTAQETATSTGSLSLPVAEEEKGCVAKVSVLGGTVTDNTATEPMTSIESNPPSTVPHSLTVIGSLSLSFADKEKHFVSKESRQKDMAIHDTVESVVLLENCEPPTVPKKMTVTGSLSLLVNDKEKDSVPKESRQEDTLTDNITKPVLSLEKNSSLTVPRTLTVTGSLSVSVDEEKKNSHL